MTELFGAHGQNAQIQWSGAGVGRVTAPDARRVRFWTLSRPAGNAAVAAGQPPFEPVDMISIQHVGERDRLDRAVREEDKLEWPQAWAAYQEGREHVPDGTPLAALFPNHPEIVESLRAIKVYTTEELASLTEQGLARAGMGARTWQDAARRFNEQRSGAQPFLEMQHENETLKGRIGTLEAMLEGLQRDLDALTKKGK